MLAVFSPDSSYLGLSSGDGRIKVKACVVFLENLRLFKNLELVLMELVYRRGMWLAGKCEVTLLTLWRQPVALRQQRMHQQVGT